MLGLPNLLGHQKQCDKRCLLQGSATRENNLNILFLVILFEKFGLLLMLSVASNLKVALPFREVPLVCVVTHRE